MKKYKKYILFLSFIQLLFSLYTDKFVFKSELYYYSLKYIILKIILFGILLVFWSFIFFIFKKIKEKNEYWIKCLKFFSIYFILMMLILFLIWPGVWVWDEYYVLEAVQKLSFEFWQHYLTSVFYAISLMLIPIPTGIIIVQIIIITIIITYIMVNINIESKIKYLLFLPFFLPPVIFQNFYPMRLTLYSYLLIFTGSYIAFNQKKGLDNINIFVLSFLTAILSVWRSEGIIYLLLIPLIILIAYYKRIKFKQYFLFILLVLLFFLILYFPQYRGTKDEYKYKLTAIINPLSVMLNSNLNGYEEVKDELSNAINVDILRDNASYLEIPAFWSYQQELLGDNFGKDQYSIIKKSYFYLIQRNPLLFLKARFKTFSVTIGLDTKSNYISHAGYNILDDNREVVKNFVSTNFFVKPINNNVRQFILNKIECRNSQDIYKGTWQFTIFWNLIISFMLLCVYAIISVLRKNWTIFFMMIALLLNAFLVFLAEPGVYFMYYFPIYLSANFIITFEVLKLFQKLKQKRVE